jgi:hypothetical protein
MKRILNFLKEVFKTRYRVVDNNNSKLFIYRVEKLHFLNKITGCWEYVDDEISLEGAKRAIERDRNPPKRVEPEIKVYHQE